MCSASVDIQVSRCGVTVGGGAEVGGACMEMEHDLQHPAQNPAQPAPAAPAPGSPHSLHWVTGEQRAGELPLQMSGWRAAGGGGGGGDTWTHTRHTKTSSQWCGTVVHTAACNQRSASTQPTNIHTKLTALLSAAITITATARASRPPNTTDMSYNLPSRAGNKPSQSWKFYNHGKGYY